MKYREVLNNKSVILMAANSIANNLWYKEAKRIIIEYVTTKFVQDINRPKQPCLVHKQY